MKESNGKGKGRQGSEDPVQKLVDAGIDFVQTGDPKEVAQFGKELEGLVQERPISQDERDAAIANFVNAAIGFIQTGKPGEVDQFNSGLEGMLSRRRTNKK